MVYSAVGIKCPECAKLPRSAIVTLKPNRAVRAMLFAFGGGLAMGFAVALLQASLGLFFALLTGYLIGLGMGELVLWASGRYRAPITGWIAIGGCVWTYACTYLLFYGFDVGDVARSGSAVFVVLGARDRRLRRLPADSVSPQAKRVLVVGGGGREHAIVRALLRSPQSPEVLCTPGNAGIARHARCFGIAAEDVDGLVRLAVDERPDLTVIGPEAPLVAGLVDRLRDRGLVSFGPSEAAARLEGSKAFAKQVMAEAGVPTASHVVLDSLEQAERQIDSTSFPAVLKADGLAAGKGVVIAATPDEAHEALRAFFVERRFGDAAEQVILEEHLEGEELSLLALCDGENVVPMAPARDYKRIGEGDTGPNTGGMGCFSPVPGLDLDRCAELIDAIHRPVVDALERRGTPYAGVLYAGLMLTAAGPKVLEFNCRFGDPETQAVLPRLESDFLETLESCVVPGGLNESRLEWSRDWAVTVVMASAGYPASSSKGDVINGLDDAELEQGVEITHAGTAESNGSVITAGGRVLNVTGLGPTPDEARSTAYAAAGRISFDGMQFRPDIASGVTDSVQVATTD